MSFSKKNLLPRSTPLQPHSRAIIVGASSGIGAALALRLARQGYTLALVARREDLLKDLCRKIDQHADDKRALYFVHDVTDHASVPALLGRIISELGGLDVFVFSAGITHPPGLRVFDFENDRQTVEVNLLGALAWLNPVAAIFQQLKSGQIVGISSVAGERGRVANPSYNASKAALTCYLEALRNRLSSHGVNVLTIKPGFIRTDSLKEAQVTFGVISPERAADLIYKAMRRRKQEAYIPGLWRLLMFVVRNIPSLIFRRLAF